MRAPEPTLQVADLHTHFFTRGGVLKAVDGVSFSVAPGQVVGLVGESGSGKSVTGFSIIGLVDPPGRVVAGRVLFQGEDLAQAGEERLRALRGHRVSMVFQDPMMTLNPVLRIDTQMVETLQAHVRISRADALTRSQDALARVGIPSPEARLTCYPHELSGGMRQRVAIAIAMLHEPSLIIADEPTTALDVTIQGQILAQMQQLCREQGTALIWITHNLAVVAGLADRICVMYAGRIVEQAATDDVLDRPLHPYTRGLIRSLPANNPRGGRLFQIPGMVPQPIHLPPGCAFAARCPRADGQCATDPAETEVSPGRTVRCHHPHLDEGA